MAIADQPARAPTTAMDAVANLRESYKTWMESQGIPIHRGYFIDDVRTVEVGKWDERGCNACFLELAGQEKRKIFLTICTKHPRGGNWQKLPRSRGWKTH